MQRILVFSVFINVNDWSSSVIPRRLGIRLTLPTLLSMWQCLDHHAKKKVLYRPNHLQIVIFMLRLKQEKTITAPIFLPQGLRPCCRPSLRRAATLSQNGGRGELCRHGPCFSHRAAYPITCITYLWLEIYFVTLTLSYSRQSFPKDST